MIGVEGRRDRRGGCRRELQFQLPTGLKKGGAYTLVARAHGMYGLADKVSTPVSFKTGPAPHVRRPRLDPGSQADGPGQVRRPGQAGRHARS